MCLSCTGSSNPDFKHVSTRSLFPVLPNYTSPSHVPSFTRIPLPAAIRLSTPKRLLQCSKRPETLHHSRGALDFLTFNSAYKHQAGGTFPSHVNIAQSFYCLAAELSAGNKTILTSYFRRSPLSGYRQAETSRFATACTWRQTNRLCTADTRHGTHHARSSIRFH